MGKGVATVCDLSGSPRSQEEKVDWAVSNDWPNCLRDADAPCMEDGQCTGCYFAPRLPTEPADYFVRADLLSDAGSDSQTAHSDSDDAPFRSPFKGNVSREQGRDVPHGRTVPRLALPSPPELGQPPPVARAPVASKHVVDLPPDDDLFCSDVALGLSPSQAAPPGVVFHVSLGASQRTPRSLGVLIKAER